MLKNYLTVALRMMRRHPGNTAINLSGLAVGLACSFFILLWVQDELSYDRFLPEGERVYRVWRNVNVGEQIYTWAGTARPMGDVLRTDYPEIESVAQTVAPGDYVITGGKESFREHGMFASPSFFEVFAFPFVHGDPASVLDREDGAVVTERTARKHFGEAADALGQTVTIDQRRDFTITGVVADLPDNSSFQFDVVLPVADFQARNAWTEFWGANGFRTYVKLREGAAPEVVSEKIAGIIMANEEGADEVLFLQAFEDLYLHSEYVDGRLVGGRIETVRIFGIVAVFLLLIAAINFMNLATARSARRVREIGVRKSIGARRTTLIGQYLGESVLMALIAYVMAVALVVALLPVFGELTDKQIALSGLDVRFALLGLGVALAVGILAGSYPALYLSSFSPIAALRGTTIGRQSRAAVLRKGLVVFQFALSTLLIVGTVAVYLQLQFIQNRDIGLNRDNLIYLPQEGPLLTQFDAVRQELLSRPGVEGVTAASSSPLSIGSSTGSATWEGKDPDEEIETYVLNADYDFLEMMGMELVAGRSFDRGFGADSAGYVINQKLASIMGGDPLGKRLGTFSQTGTVIGVVRDFDMNSLYVPDEPVIIRLRPGATSGIYVRAEPGATAEVLASMESVARAFAPAHPFDPHFLSSEYETAYRSEVVLGRLANVFAGIAVFISCLGLYGLVSYAAEQRTKEIGVRKVLGASVIRLVMLLTSDQMKLVAVGILIGAPVAHFAVDAWLQNFERHFEVGLGLFAFAGIVAVAVAGLTVAAQAARAALVNPVESLRSE